MGKEYRKSINFEFLGDDWSDLSALGAFAEAYVHTDPESALVKLRVLAEMIVDGIYRKTSLTRPVQPDFIYLLDDNAFKELTPKKVLDKLHAIRINGNKGAHPGEKVTTNSALWLLREAHDLARWFFSEHLGGEYKSCPDYQEPPTGGAAAETKSRLQQQKKAALVEVDDDRVSWLLSRHTELFAGVCEHAKLDPETLQVLDKKGLIYRNSLAMNENIQWTEDLLIEYEEKLNWFFVSYNQSIDWNADMLLRFSEPRETYFLEHALVYFDPETLNKTHQLWPWKTICKYGRFKDSQIIKEYAGRVCWDSLSENDRIDWTDSLIFENDRRLNFDKLFQNSAFLVNTECVRAYLRKLEQFKQWNVYMSYLNQSFPLDLKDETLIYDMHKKLLSALSLWKGDWDKEYLDELKGISIIDVAGKVIRGNDFSRIKRLAGMGPWKLISSSSLIPWTKELLECYKDSWEWSELSSNPSIPWDEELLQKYEDKICWDRLTWDCSHLLSKRAVDRYVEKWDWRDLCAQASPFWDLHTLEYAERHWPVDWESVSPRYFESLDTQLIQKTAFKL